MQAIARRLGIIFAEKFAARAGCACATVGVAYCAEQLGVVNVGRQSDPPRVAKVVETETRATWFSTSTKTKEIIYGVSARE